MDENSIKGKAFSGAIWKFMERILAQGISLVVSIEIARILIPEDYTVVSLVTIFFTFANILISGGLNTALIQKKDADDEDYSSVLFFSFLLSVVVYFVLFALAPIIAQVYKQPILIYIIRVMCLILPISAIKSIWCAYISAHLQFRKFFFATIVGTVVSAFIGIGMAIKGYGAWALVAQQMSNTFIDTVILVISTRIHISFSFSQKKLMKLFRYGWKVLVSSLLGTVYTEIMPLFIGIRYKGSDLSFYTKGRSFPYLISTTTTNTLSAVLFPVLSRYQDDKQALLKYTRLFIRLASYICFPLMLGLFIIADNFVCVILKEKWLMAVPYIRIFSVSCMFDMIHVGNCETIKAMGRSDIYLIMEIIKKTAYFLTIIVFLFFSKTPEILACAFIVCTVIAIIVNSIPNKKLIGYTYYNQAADIIPNLIVSIIMCIPTYLVGLLEVGKFWVLFLQIITGVFSYVFLSFIMKNSSFFYLLDLVKNFCKKK